MMMIMMMVIENELHMHVHSESGIVETDCAWMNDTSLLDRMLLEPPGCTTSDWKWLSNNKQVLGRYLTHVEICEGVGIEIDTKTENVTPRAGVH